MFFVLSGFLLYRPFAAAIVRATAPPSIRRYFVNRVLRIIPAYWVVLLVVAACFQRGLLDRPVQLVANMLFLQDFDPGYVPGVFTGYGIAPAWSLCVEVMFYLCLPLLAVFGLALRRRRVGGARAALSPAVLMLLAGVVSLEARARSHSARSGRWAFPTICTGSHSVCSSPWRACCTRMAGSSSSAPCGSGSEAQRSSSPRAR